MTATAISIRNLDVIFGNQMMMSLNLLDKGKPARR